MEEDLSKDRYGGGALWMYHIALKGRPTMGDGNTLYLHCTCNHYDYVHVTTRGS